MVPDGLQKMNPLTLEKNHRFRSYLSLWKSPWLFSREELSLVFFFVGIEQLNKIVFFLWDFFCGN